MVSRGGFGRRYAAISGQVSSIAWLVSKGADVDVPDKTASTPLYWACFHGHSGAAMRLLKNGARHSFANAHGVTPAAAARARGHAPLAAVIDALAEARPRRAAPRRAAEGGNGSSTPSARRKS